MNHRNQTKVIRIGDRVIGGGNPILIQSMTNTKTEDVESTVDQAGACRMRDHSLHCTNSGGCKSDWRN